MQGQQSYTNHPKNFEIIHHQMITGELDLEIERNSSESSFLLKFHKILNQQEFIKMNSERFNTLTPREKEILIMVAYGDTNQKIADHLSISINTSKTHRKNIKSKLNIKTTRELIEYAQAFDLI